MSSVSDEKLNKIKARGGRIIPKAKAPEPVKPDAGANLLKEAFNTAVDKMVQANLVLARAVGQIKISSPEVHVPEAKFIQADRPRIKQIHITNIQRNGQNRIDSADFDVTYED